jgi:hypothetical protein
VNVLELAVVGMAVWRIASMITSERGPFDIFTRIRKLAGVVHNEFGLVDAIPDGNFAYLLTCVWCFSVILAIPYVILLYFFRDAMMWISYPFAISALAILFGSHAERE